MKILIVGAGTAGLTLSALLNRRGVYPTVIEKAKGHTEAGYILGLYPLGGNVLHGLGCYDAYIAQTEAALSYQALSFKGTLQKSMSLAQLSAGFGDYQMTSRQQLLALLLDNCQSPVQFDTTIQALTPTDTGVNVTINNGVEEHFDLVIGADGIHSVTRTLILSADEYQSYDTGWGGFVWWADKADYPAGVIKEYWGNGKFFGVYPTKDKIGLIAAMPQRITKPVSHLPGRHQLIELHFAEIFADNAHFLAALPGDEAPVFYWPLTDGRANVWHKGRVVLLGDAATTFLPTAGVGASMAMESAAALNDILSRCDVTTLPQGLKFFSQRRKARVEKAQNDSRRLAKMMFVESRLGCYLRDVSLKMMSTKALLGSIVKSFDTPL